MKPLVTTDRLHLSLLDAADADRVVAYVQRNEGHLGRWEPPRPDGFCTTTFWEHQIELNHAEREAGTALRLFLIDRADPEGPLVGSCNFFNVVRGALQACSLGYSLDRDRQGRGYMTEACRGALRYVFEEWNLHRVMAHYQPSNERSGRLLRSLGFVVEGYARDYLFIDGAWRDHILTSLVNPQHVFAARSMAPPMPRITRRR